MRLTLGSISLRQIWILLIQNRLVFFAKLNSHTSMPRAGGDPNRPRGKMTAYACFVKVCRDEHKKKHPDETVVFQEFSRKCAERWKTMSEAEKKRFKDMADEDSKRYDHEMQYYVPPPQFATDMKKKKKKKDPTAPKRALSAFFWYCADRRADVKKDNPDWTVGQIARELGKEWANVTPEVKGKYEAMAQKDKARYDRDMEAYRGGGGAAGGGGAVGNQNHMMGSPSHAAPQQMSDQQQQQMMMQQQQQEQLQQYHQQMQQHYQMQQMQQAAQQQMQMYQQQPQGGPPAHLLPSSSMPPMGGHQGVGPPQGEDDGTGEEDGTDGEDTDE